MSEKNSQLYVDEKGFLRREGMEEPDVNQENTGTNCSSCNKKQACISFLAHENAMMHKDVDNERAHRTTLFVCIAFVLIVIIFVTAYTVRTSIWLDTVKQLNADIVELACAKGIIAP